MGDPRFGEHFEQTWDAVLRGDSSASGLDPSLAETLRRVHALDRVPPPDPVFVSRARDELVTSMARPLGRDPFASRAPDGRTVADPWWSWRWMPASVPERRRWALGQVATVLLLLFTLLAAYFAFGPGRPHPADIPGVEPTVAATPEPGVTIVPLGAGVADTLPDEPAWLMTFHSTFRPGGRYGLEPAEGPDLVAVTAGTMTYHADRPLVVTRRSDGNAPGPQEVVPADTDAVLGAGDSVLIPLGANVSRQNDGTDTAVEVMAMIEGTFLGSRGRSGASGGVVDLPIVTFHVSDAKTLPPAPVTIALRQVTVAPGARFTPPAASWWMVGTPEEAYTHLERLPDGTAVNSGSDPIDLYLTTVEPLEGGTPVP